ncbi:MAG: hypothetical protein QOE65_2165 [Solirubrobacteraceae bacterium]|jgi:hypothetical protein|nr:hypothetical protein [Solirubrobacteraceae bacterium]
MPESSSVQVTDLRGRVVPAVAPVLSDPTGRRAALLRQAGRAVAALFLLWLVGLVLAGLGLFPLADLPLGRVLAPTSEPKALPALPRPETPARADLRPAALPGSTQAAARAGGTASLGSARGVTRRTTRSSPATRRAPASRTTTPATAPQVASPTRPSPSANAPGQTRTPPGQVNRVTRTPSPAPSDTAAPGRSETAPGHDPTRTTGHGPPPR